MSRSVVILRRIEPDRNMERFYRLDVQLDLFGEWCLVREWGRIGRSGRTCTNAFPDAQQAEAALQRLSAAKVRRGYRDMIVADGDEQNSNSERDVHV